MASSESSSPSPRVSNRLIKNLVLAFLIGGVLVALIGIIVFSWEQQTLVANVKADSSLLGNMGSFLSGTVGVIWSLASVFLFYLALREQRKDIKINQDALNLQIKELEDTRMVYIDQSNTFKTQGFENTFFELLQLHASTVKDLTYTSSWQRQNSTSNGKAVFIVWKQELDHFSSGHARPPVHDVSGFPMESLSIPFASFEEIELALNTSYKKAYHQYENTLNHYFRQLYHIFKYVHLSPLITDDRRSFYTSLVRAQLSQNELYAIVYNSLVNGYGKPNFLFLIKKYNLAKNFNHSNLPSQLIWEYFKHEQELVSDPFV
uniref:putative phage abortive infection protein n=1 Tax=Pedobacter schmidteae TaxID=2201271 RepID=UPI000EAFD7C2|nr:putative phage abortive infection protein [Pedobacter schmidteae]